MSLLMGNLHTCIVTRENDRVKKAEVKFWNSFQGVPDIGFESSE